MERKNSKMERDREVTILKRKGRRGKTLKGKGIEKENS
jgi:hypothetical protein